MFIQLAIALQEMEKSLPTGRQIPFTVSYWTADRHKRTGGELIKLEGAVLSRKKGEKKASISGTFTEENFKSSKSPNHYTNATRNFLLPNGEIRKCHIRLIETFNGMEVHW